MKIAPLDIRATLNNPPPKLDFVLPGLLAGSAGTIVGSGGVGKTMLLMQVATAIATGTSNLHALASSAATPSRVVFIAAEEPADILRLRLKAISRLQNSDSFQLPELSSVLTEQTVELMEKNLQLIPAAGQSVFLTKNGEPTDFYEELCKFCKGARLVIVDPLRRLHDGDENSSAAMTGVVQVLESLAKRTDAAVIAAHHMNKGAAFAGTADAASASRGSSALTDAVRWQLNLSLMTEQEAAAFGMSSERKSYVKLDYAKTNYAAPQPTIWLKRLDGGALIQAIPEKESKGVKNKSRASKANSYDNKGFTYV